MSSKLWRLPQIAGAAKRNLFKSMILQLQILLNVSAAHETHETGQQLLPKHKLLCRLFMLKIGRSCPIEPRKSRCKAVPEGTALSVSVSVGPSKSLVHPPLP